MYCKSREVLSVTVTIPYDTVTFKIKSGLLRYLFSNAWIFSSVVKQSLPFASVKQELYYLNSLYFVVNLMLWILQTLSSLAIAGMSKFGCKYLWRSCHLSTEFLRIVYLFKPCFLHVDLWFSGANDTTLHLPVSSNHVPLNLLSVCW